MLLAVAYLLFCSFQAVAQTPANQVLPSPAVWNSLLQRCVRPVDNDHSTAVDYNCFSSHEDELDGYLDALSEISETVLLSQDKGEQLAFLINAYNAWTLKLILGDWPEVESIRDLGSFLRSPWKKPFIPLLGKLVSLDDIEHGMIREAGRFDDPRIHFAVNCASVGCPALRRDAYIGETIDTQLEEQAKSFLADPSRNRLRDGVLEVSSIFKWYRDDFEKGWRGLDSLEDFLQSYGASLRLTSEQRAQLSSGDMDLEFLDYDWQLNSTP